MRRVLAIVILVLVAGFVLSRISAPGSNGPGAAGWYEAKPVYGLIGSGFYLQVTSRQAASTPNGAEVVMQVVFKNQGRTQFSTKPADFQLAQSTGGLILPDFSIAACPQWQDIQVAAGTTSRPVPLCFPGADPSGAISLLWQPNVAPPPFGTETRIDLSAQPAT